jgi:hypothetical protein
MGYLLMRADLAPLHLKTYSADPIAVIVPRPAAGYGPALHAKAGRTA